MYRQSRVKKRNLLLLPTGRQMFCCFLTRRTSALVEKTNAITPNIASQSHRITDWLGLGGTLKSIQFQTPAMGRDTFC